MNSCVLSGNISTDVELKHTQSGIPVTSFNLAVRRPHTKDVTDFFTVVAWRSTAEFISSYFQKGDGIEVRGYAMPREFKDKNGNKRTVTEFTAEEVDFGKSRRNKETARPSGGAAYEQNNSDDGFVEVNDDSPFSDDLPF